MTAARGFPLVDLDIIAELRRKCDESAAKRVHLEHEIALRDARIRMLEQDVIKGLRDDLDAIRQTLIGTAELAEAEGEPADKRGAAWWRGAWREVTRHRSELILRMQQLERWHLEHGAEATRLQRDLDVARQEIGELTRQLDLARDGERIIADESAEVH